MSAARFYKADLQMQTPVDRLHWRGGERLLPGCSAEERRVVAEAYMRRCYEVGLEVIGITEHNLAPDDCESLLPELQAAAADLSGEFGYQIEIFPGFELEVTIGRGIHVLCLFEPGTTVARLSEKLTQLHLPVSARFADGQPQPVPSDAEITLERLIRIVQGDATLPGLLVLAHASGGSGVMDSDKLVQWWSADVIKDERILCMELPQPRSHYLSLDQQTLTKSVLQNVDPRYRRQHPIATICSSDCKAIVPSEHLTANFIGFRHTWLKLGSVTIEGLRQAFLDHDSRVRFGERSPDDSTHPRISSASIAGGSFLVDQDVNFSPNLTVIIGGSGTGKSTIVNYLRMCLGQSEVIHGEDVRANFERTARTLRPETSVLVSGQLSNEQFVVQSRGRQKGEVSAPGTALNGQDVTVIFPVRFFGQREIYSIAEDRTATVGLVDDLHRDELARLQRRAQQLVETHQSANATATQLATLLAEIGQVEAQHARALTALDRAKDIAEPLATLADAQDAAVAADALHAAGVEAGTALNEARKRLSGGLDGVSPGGDARVATLRQQYADALEALSARVQAAEDQFNDDLSRITQSPAAMEVAQEQHWAREVVNELRAGLVEQGVDPDAFAEYRRDVERLEGEAADLRSRISAAETAARERADALTALQACWSEETSLRRQSAQRLNDAVPRTSGGDPFVRVAVVAFGDDRGFRRLMSDFRGDRRRLSDDDWDDLLRAVVDASSDRPPNHVLLEWLDRLAAEATPEGFPWADSARAARVLACFPADTRHAVATMRVPDRIEIVLRRQDGTVAGEIEEGLSVGQKCTAVLALLLAADTTPVVIDQPEDEIDNEFTYREMVPLIRKVKEGRQVIVVTHDPNIPVNGDAEMIHALAAIDGRGGIKMVDGQGATGALDRRCVRLAVEEIMEGSEEAFRRRFVKYGF